jgi:hypothetical protein
MKHFDEMIPEMLQEMRDEEEKNDDPDSTTSIIKMLIHSNTPQCIRLVNDARFTKMYKRLPKTMIDEEKIIATLDHAMLKMQMQKHELEIKRREYYYGGRSKEGKDLTKSNDPIGDLHDFIQNNRSEI